MQRYSELVAEKQKVQNDIDAKDKTLVTLDESVKNSKVQLERLEHLMAEGRAFELVHLVVDNEPCPVCGSTEHPQLQPSLSYILQRGDRRGSCSA